MKTTPLINMSTQEFSRNVHKYFAKMRRESPVCQAQMTRWQKVYLITQYADVAAALKDSRLVKNPNNAKSESGRSSMYWMPKPFRPLMHNMLNSDEPDHRRLRNLVHKAFTPRMIAQLEPRIEAIAIQLLDAAQTKRDVDFIQEFALPLPINVIAEMIGIPEEDRARFRAWTKSIIVAPTPFNMVRAIPSVLAFLRYVRKLANQRRVEPQDDLLTALVHAEDEGDRFTEDELLGMVFLLLVAGHETTVSLLANGVVALLNNPEQLALLKDNPNFIETAIEEMLRYDGALQTAESSFARETFSLHGVTISQGSMVLPAILSANRDESMFNDAAQFDVTRTPNKHLAFGHGIHYCLGAPLARLEGKIAFQTLLERCPNMRMTIDPAKLRYSNLPIIHRLAELPVAIS
ncbi:cytochrome P450 [Chloroflexi bacterium TSY]|nr:cytochrome P450 [Chloroflexi bacterium TSY]